MPLQATSGAASYDAFGGGVPFEPIYIEQVFQNWLYTGNGATQTITNGIDLAGKGGLVWIKSRAVAGNHFLMDTARGFNTGVSPAAAYKLSSDSTSAQGTSSELTAFNSNGFTLGSSWVMNDDGSVSGGNTYASWTFRKQPKFFDVVTYTGDGQNLRDIPHNLKARPGFIIIKRTDSTGDWFCAARSGNSGSDYVYRLLKLNSTAASAGSNSGNTDTTFNVGVVSYVYEASTDTNINGATYVAYLFAHNAGGFGLTGTDNVISCGSFLTDSGGNATVTLGYEPQFVMWKASSTTGGWNMLDTMRGFTVGGSDALLSANSTSAETSIDLGSPTATGFTAAVAGTNATYIYIAIRRGPMKVPTSGTSVFSPNQTSGTTGTQITTNFPLDWQILGINAGNVNNQRVSTRLTGVNTDGSSNSQYLITSKTNAEAATASLTLNWGNTGFQVPSLNSGSPIITWNFQRAPSFFDVVCYTGTGSATTVTHNLQAVPELIITKCRGDAFGWAVYSSAVGNTAALFLETTAVPDTNSAYWNNTTPTSTVFSVGSANRTNRTSLGMVAYLFATCAGVSKVGSYTGNGSTQTINCGFGAGGARFVLIKRTDSTGDWYVYDTARGMTTLTDPYLLLNSTAAESATLGSVTTVSTGFAVNASILAAINTNAASYIFFAVA